MFLVNQLSGFGVGGEAYKLLGSVIIVQANNNFFHRSSIASLNQQKGTWSYWAKYTSLGGRRIMFSTGTSGGAPGHQQEKGTGDLLESYGYASGFSCVANSGAVPDTNWHHILEAFDTTQGSSATRVHYYEDGVEVTFGTNNIGGVNIQGATDHHYYGTKQSGPGQSTNMDGKMADIHYINGQVLTPSDFIVGSGSGLCHPKKYLGTYPTGSYHLGFANLDFTDDSGNGLNFTNDNGCTFSSTDVPV